MVIEVIVIKPAYDCYETSHWSQNGKGFPVIGFKLNNSDFKGRLRTEIVPKFFQDQKGPQLTPS